MPPVGSARAPQLSVNGPQKIPTIVGIAFHVTVAEQVEKFLNTARSWRKGVKLAEVPPQFPA
jgi:hypothetical protein